jgi:hypothetical protein
MPLYDQYTDPRRRQKQLLYILLLVAGCICVIGLFDKAVAHANSSTRSGDSKPRHIVVEPGSSSFRLHGSKGFEILVNGTVKDGVRLVAARRHEAAVYLARTGRIDGTKTTAIFGGLGKISVTFHPRRRVKVNVVDPTGHCKLVQGRTVQIGYFTGRIRFDGEQNYTRVAAKRVRGRQTPRRVWRCRSGQRERKVKGTRGDSLSVSASWVGPSWTTRHLVVGGEAISELRSLVRSGVQLRLGALPKVGVPFRAETIEERHHYELLILRFVVLKAGSDSFDVSPDRSSAVVTPPRPFAGFAKYQRCSPSALAWRGSLKVSLPGLSPVALTGRRFTAELSPGQRCTHETR